METPCSRPIQTITENEFLGNSLRKLNDNFQVLQVNLCQIKHNVAYLNEQLTKANIPLNPRCGEETEDDIVKNICPEIEKAVNVPDPETCVQETRLPLVNSFFNLKEIGCDLYTTTLKISAEVMKKIQPDQILPYPPFDPFGCTYTDGISPDEYLGDSYDKIRSNLITLRNEYCTSKKIVNNLEKRVVCQRPSNTRMLHSKRFKIQGEGGYNWNSYSFVNNDKILGIGEGTDSYAKGLEDILGVTDWNTKYRYQVTYGTTTYVGASGALFAIQSPKNNSIAFKNGVFYYSGGTPNGPYRNNWLAQNADSIQDVYTPPTTETIGGPTQVVLLTSGDLYYLDLVNAKTQSHLPPKILSNVDRIACVNQSKNSDIIVVTNDKRLYHVAVKNTTNSPSTYVANQIANVSNTDNIKFIQIGDGADTGYICYSNDNTKVYPIVCNSTRSPNRWEQFTSISNVSKNVLLDLDEYFIDGCSNQYDYIFLTSERVLTYVSSNAPNTCSVPNDEFLIPSSLTPKRIVSSNAYSITIELSDGYYLLSRRQQSDYLTVASNTAACGGYPAYPYLQKFNYWTDLITSLSAYRPDIFGLKSDEPCPCDEPLPPEPPPGCEPVRPDLLNRFLMQGEGGYLSYSYNFVDNDKIFAQVGYDSSAFRPIFGSYYTTYAYTTSIAGKTWYGVKNAIRCCDGHNNVMCIMRNGNCYYGGAEYFHQWILNTYNNWKDIFMPSSYGSVSQITQGLLFKTGEMYALRPVGATAAQRLNGPPLLSGTNWLGATVPLNNIDRILTVNQAHNGDMIVAGRDDTVWHVVFGQANNPTTQVVDIGGWGQQIKNLWASKIHALCIGDQTYSSFIVLKADRTKLYKFVPVGNRWNGRFSWWTRDFVPVCEGVNKPATIGSTVYPNFLQTGEYFVDVLANEFQATLLTNKHIHTFADSGASYYKWAIPAGLSAVRMSYSTSYSMVAVLSDGYYFVSNTSAAALESSTGNGTWSTALYNNVSKIQTWVNLAQVLSSGRPDIVPFGSSCDQPANWNCLKTFVEDADVAAFPAVSDVGLQTNLFYPVSAYQEGLAWLNGAGVGFTGTTTVTFRHPNYPTEPDKVFTYNSDPNSTTGDAIIWWSKATNQVNFYFNYPTGLVKIDTLPWIGRDDILVSYNFTGGIIGSVVAKQYKDPDTSICFFPVRAEDVPEDAVLPGVTPTPTPTLTPTPVINISNSEVGEILPGPTPSPTPTETPTETPTPTPTPTPTQAPGAISVPLVGATPLPTNTPTPTRTPAVTPTTASLLCVPRAGTWTVPAGAFYKLCGNVNEPNVDVVINGSLWVQAFNLTCRNITINGTLYGTGTISGSLVINGSWSPGTPPNTAPYVCVSVCPLPTPTPTPVPAGGGALSPTVVAGTAIVTFSSGNSITRYGSSNNLIRF